MGFTGQIRNIAPALAFDQDEYETHKHQQHHPEGTVEMGNKPVSLSEHATVGPHGGVVLHPEQTSRGEENPR